MRYTDVWNDITKRIGYWVDMDNPYITYMKISIWNLFGGYLKICTTKIYCTKDIPFSHIRQGGNRFVFS
ncbi:MAG: hypothetical protein R2728_06895 [Chitinophagales bacterium]